MRHVVNVVLLIAVMTLVMMYAARSVDWMPLAASVEAGPVDWLFNLHIDVIVFLYVLVNGILLYSVFVFRRKKNDQSEGAYFHGHTGLEIVWTIVPLFVVLYFAYLGGAILRQTTAAAVDEIEVLVNSQQWTWSFEYPDLGMWNPEYAGMRLASSELNLPVDRKVYMRLFSADVTHSFWVPEFRLKQDMVPGQVKHLRLTPSVIGAYKVRCAELCGTSHAYMLANVNVMSAEDFDIWVQRRLGIYVEPEGEEPTEQDLVALGAQVAQSAGCVACHSVDGSQIVGPTWRGLWGHTVTLEDGSTVVADEDYIYESIVDPGAKIVAGFQNVMPSNYGDILTPREIEALIAYIQSVQ